MSNTKNMVLESSEPLDDGGRRLNLIYPISALVIGFAFLICGGGFIGLIFGIVLGLVVGWLIKNKICDLLDQKFRYYTFNIKNKKPYPELIADLIPELTPLGMTIEKNAEGIPIIMYKGLIYDVHYNDDQTFTIWWRKNVARAFLTVDSIGEYRNISVAMGIIGYYVQQICNNNQQTQKTDYSQQSTEAENNTENNDDNKMLVLFCSKCGTKLGENDVFCPQCGKRI